MKKQNNQNNVLDERQMQIRSKSTLATLVFVLTCLIIAMIYRVATTDEIGWEFWVIIGACLVSVISNRFFGDIEEPKDIFGKPLPLGNSREDKMARIKDYVLQSGIFALACMAMDIILIVKGRDDVTDMEVAEMIFPNLGRTETIIVTAVIAFVSMFAISFICEYFIGEKFKVKRYNKLMAELDAEEDDIVDE